MIVEPSASETARFGLAVGRAHIDDDAAVASAADMERLVENFDVIIVRAPAGRRDLAARLACVASHALVPADHLCYWSWERQRFTAVAAPDGFSLEETTDMSLLAPLVRDAFSEYGNHYQANPLLDPEAALEGYCEWVAGLLGTESSCLLLRSADGGPVGFGLVDWSNDVPDIRLAAMATSSQGRGLYASMLSGLMSEALHRGHDRLLISTQSDNVRVMRAWARLGLLPDSTLATHHLIRRQLL